MSRSVPHINNIAVRVFLLDAMVAALVAELADDKAAQRILAAADQAAAGAGLEERAARYAEEALAETKAAFSALKGEA